MSLDRFVGIPAAPDGSDRAGAHCYGLVAIVYREALGIELPPVIDAEAWVEIGEGAERPFDVILLRERPFHVGIVVRRGLMLHMREDDASATEPYTTGRYGRRVEGFFRHVSRT